MRLGILDEEDRFAGSTETKWRASEDQFLPFLTSLLGYDSFAPSFPQQIHSNGQFNAYSAIVIEEVEMIPRRVIHIAGDFQRPVPRFLCQFVARRIPETFSIGLSSPQISLSTAFHR